MSINSYDTNTSIEKIFLISEDLKIVKQIHDSTEHRFSDKGEKIILFWKDTSREISFYKCVGVTENNSTYSQWVGIANSEVSNELKTLALLLK